MDTNQLIILALMGLGLLEINIVVAEVAPESITKLPPLNCKKIMMVVASKQFKAFGKCSKELKDRVSDPEEYQKRISCIAKCAMEKEKLIDSKQQINLQTVNDFLDALIPKEYHIFAHDILDSCMTQFEGKLDQKDKYCSSYGNFIKCMQDKAVDVLNSEMCISSPAKEPEAEP